MSTTTRRVTCPTCHGTGFERCAPDTAAKALRGEGACPTCDSTGSVPDLHPITLHPSVAPNLDDLMRLIRYLREHGIVVHPGAAARTDDVYPLKVEWTNMAVGTRPWALSVTEGIPAWFHYVGPDGIAYDAKRNPL